MKLSNRMREVLREIAGERQAISAKPFGATVRALTRRGLVAYRRDTIGTLYPAVTPEGRAALEESRP